MYIFQMAIFSLQHIQIFLRQKVTCHDCQLGLHNAAQMPHLLDQFQTMCDT